MIELKNVNICYARRNILSGDVEFERGKITGIIGESGSGKSSLLNVVSLYSYDQDFNYFYNGINLKDSTKEYLSQLMKQKIAYLRQDNRFLDTMTCLENLLLECGIAGIEIKKTEIVSVLSSVGLENVKDKYPKQLSGGEKQRLAIAMAIVKKADVILCDEITSSLDNTNTLAIMEILKRLAYEDKKIVVLASHEKSVIDICDEVYEIKNKEINSIKSAESDLSLINKDIVIKDVKNKKYILQIALSRLKKKKLLFGLLIVVAAFSIAMVSYSVTYLQQQEKITANLLSTALSNEIFVNNNMTEHNFKPFNMNEFPIEENIIDKIEALKNVESVYPFYTLSVLNTNFPVGEESGALVQWFDGDTKVGEFKFDKTSLYTDAHCIYPYYEEQHLSDLVEQSYHDGEGIYLDKVAAKTLGITEVTENMKMQIDVYIPVAMIDIQIVQGAGGALKDAKSYSHFIKETIELPISGILPNSYTDSGVASTTTSIFIPFDYMEELFVEAMSQYTCLDGETYYKANAIKVFVDSPTNMNKVKNEIVSISSTLLLFNASEDYTSASEAEENQSGYLKASMVVVILVLAILLYVYGVYHKKDALDDYYFLNIRGFLKKEKKQITVLECLSISMVVFLFSLIVVNYFISNGIGQYRLATGMVAPVSYFSIVIIDLIISIFASIICELPLLVMSER